MKCFIKIILLVCFCFCINVQAQQQLIDRPYIERVSVDPETGDITIDWNVISPQVNPFDTEGFEIFWYHEEEIGGTLQKTNYCFHTIPDPNARSYTFKHVDLQTMFPELIVPDPSFTSVAFSVGAYNNTQNVKSLRSYEHYNTQINSIFDLCKTELRLTWYQYRGWVSNVPPNHGFKSYTLMIIPEGGGAHQQITELFSQRDTSFVIKEIDNKKLEANKTYSFYIIAERISYPGEKIITATSYLTTVKTEMQAPPSYINALNTQYNDDGYVKIKFEIDPDAETRLFQFSGSNKAEYAFVPLATLNIYGNDTILTDIQRRGDTYYYRLDAWHTCMHEFTTNSNTVTALWLSVEQEDMANSLQWKPFTKWKNNSSGNNIDARYEIWRKIGDGPEEYIDVVFDPDKTIFKDPFKDIGCIEDEMCYWLKAVPRAPNSSAEYAISNVVCIKPEPRIFIPQAFTPDGFVENSRWIPTFEPCIFDSYLKDFLLIVYDRTGAKVFETKNYNDEGWNGKLLNGKPANEGVYVYTLRYVTSIGRVIERVGTLSLIRP